MPGFACRFEGCDHVDRGGHGWCRMHYMRWWKHGDPSTTKAAHRFVGDDVTYSGAHIRVRSARGRASALACVECSESAAHWTYDHADPNEKVDERGRPFSPDPQHYRPMCVSCHKKADLAVKEPALVRDELGRYRSAS